MSKRVTFADLIIFLLIAVFGVSTVLLHQRAADFLAEDAFYADAAQCLLHYGFFGVNGVPETTQPPGLAAILAVLFSIFGYSYAVCVGAMAVFETLGFLLAYEFLRRRVSMLVATTICILLLSSPLYFGWATRMVYPCFAYFFTTMLALLAGDEYDRASTTRSRIVWGTVLTIAVVASLLIATSTVALLGAVAAVVVLTALKERCLARIRPLKFLPVFLVGSAVLGVWMLRKPAPLEWPLPGYPRSYVQQLKVKNGRHPELGMAKWSDIPARVTTNLVAEGDILAQLLLRHGVDRTNVAVVIVPFLLTVIGWTFSIVKTRGMELVDWYFAGYQFIYALWPWTMDTRFTLPIAPIACFYMWQGINGAILASRTKPRVVGIIWFPAALLLTIFGTHWIYTQRSSGNRYLPATLIVPVWLISAGIAAWMAYTGKSVFSAETSSKVGTWIKQPLSKWQVSPLHLLRYSIYLIVTALVLIGIVSDARIARENLNAPDFNNIQETGTYEFLATEIEAGLWLRSNTPSDAVVMARHWPTVYHYAQRKLVWFAPISDPHVLLEGIVRHGVNYVVVVKHGTPYYLPDDDYCFDRLLAIYRDKFRLVLERANLRIFKVEERVDTALRDPSR
jgi:hypothetical protein